MGFGEVTVSEESQLEELLRVGKLKNGKTADKDHKRNDKGRRLSDYLETV